jgi:hypothetical protein
MRRGKTVVTARPQTVELQLLYKEQLQRRGRLVYGVLLTPVSRKLQKQFGPDQEPSAAGTSIGKRDDPFDLQAKPEISGGRKSRIKSIDRKPRLWRKPNRSPPGRLCP